MNQIQDKIDPIDNNNNQARFEIEKDTVNLSWNLTGILYGTVTIDSML